MHPDSRQAFIVAGKVLFAEFIPKDEQAKPEEAGIIREYRVEVRRVDKALELPDGTDNDDPVDAGERIRTMIAGDPERAKRAVEFYIAMADKGNVQAMYELGTLYWEGICVEYDYDKAKEWMCRAAAKGSEKALEFLADLQDEDGRYDGEV